MDPTNVTVVRSDSVGCRLDYKVNGNGTWNETVMEVFVNGATTPTCSLKYDRQTGPQTASGTLKLQEGINYVRVRCMGRNNQPMVTENASFKLDSWNVADSLHVAPMSFERVIETTYLVIGKKD